jgi:hypothetical protein
MCLRIFVTTRPETTLSCVDFSILPHWKAKLANEMIDSTQNGKTTGNHIAQIWPKMNVNKERTISFPTPHVSFSPPLKVKKIGKHNLIFFLVQI